MDLDLRLVRYALAVAETLHFGHAAARLSISQQTLSAQIKRLEDRLGVALFVRDRRRVELTTHGRTFMEHGQRLIDESEALMMALRPSSTALRVDVIAYGLTPMLIGRHLRITGCLAMETTERQGEVASLPLVAAGSLDLAFAPARTPVPDGVTGEVVALDPVHLVLPESHPLSTQEVISLERLRGLRVLVNSPRASEEWPRWQEDLIKAFRLVKADRVYSDGTGMLGAAVLERNLPAFTSGQHLSMQGIAVRPLVDPVPLFAWSIFWRKRTRDDRIAVALREIRNIVTRERLLEPTLERVWLPDAGFGAQSRPNRSRSARPGSAS